MSTPHSTLVSEILTEYNTRPGANAGPSTPKDAHARMIQLVNAANGLRYEVARFGDIERQLKAVQEKMEPLVLRAKELNDLICERVSQTNQPWADSRIHEMEELVQKVQQLERENDSLIENVRGMEQMVDRLERENAALREKNDEWREMIREAVFEKNDILYWIRGARSILLEEVKKDLSASKKAQP